MTDTTADAVHFEGEHAHDAHHDADHKPGVFARWLTSPSPRDIGTLSLILAVVAGIIGGGISGLMRWELAEPGLQHLDTWAGIMAGGPVDLDQARHMWNVLISAHGLIMVFFMV